MKLSIKLLIFFLLLFWFMGIFYEWLIYLNSDLIKYFPIVNKTYSLVCHQDKSKLIKINGLETLVCARCLGIYSGAVLLSFASLFISLKYKPNFNLTFVILLIVLIDVLFTTIKIYNYSYTIALISGILLGSISFLYLYASLIQLFKEKFNR